MINNNVPTYQINIFHSYICSLFWWVNHQPSFLAFKPVRELHSGHWNAAGGTVGTNVLWNEAVGSPNIGDPAELKKGTQSLDSARAPNLRSMERVSWVCTPQTKDERSLKFRSSCLCAGQIFSGYTRWGRISMSQRWKENWMQTIHQKSVWVKEMQSWTKENVKLNISKKGVHPKIQWFQTALSHKDCHNFVSAYMFSPDMNFSLTQHTPVQWQRIKLEVFKHHISNGDDILPRKKLPKSDAKTLIYGTYATHPKVFGLVRSLGNLTPHQDTGCRSRSQWCRRPISIPERRGGGGWGWQLTMKVLGDHRMMDATSDGLFW